VHAADGLGRMVLDDRRVDEEPPRRTGSACGGGLRDQREDDVALERCQFVFARVYVGEGGRDNDLVVPRFRARVVVTVRLLERALAGLKRR
jgi:hypothetical protein